MQIAAHIAASETHAHPTCVHAPPNHIACMEQGAQSATVSMGEGVGGIDGT